MTFKRLGKDLNWNQIQNGKSSFYLLRIINCRKRDNAFPVFLHARDSIDLNGNNNFGPVLKHASRIIVAWIDMKWKNELV